MATKAKRTDTIRAARSDVVKAARVVVQEENEGSTSVSLTQAIRDLDTAIIVLDSRTAASNAARKQEAVA